MRALVVLVVALPLAGQNWRAFDRYVAEAVRDWQTPGLAIAVVHGDTTVFQRGYGVRAIGTRDTVNEHTLFANASTTKAFTAMAIAMLADEGRLGLDDPVTRWLPGFRMYDPWVTREITIRDLLSHRVGLGDPGWLWYGRDDDWATIMRRLGYVEPATSFRSAYAYNNVTFAAAGVIAGVAADLTWDQVIRDWILDPLEMTETVTRGDHLRVDANVAWPHDVLDDTLEVLDVFTTVDPIPAAGAMYSSVSDMAKWLKFLLDPARQPRTGAELFLPQTVIRPGQFYPTATRTVPQYTAYGLGWFLQNYRGERIAFHTGSIDGYVAIVGLMPERRVGVVIFANRDHVEVRHALMWRVFDMYLGGTPRDWSAELHAMYDSLAARDRTPERTEGTSPTFALANYAGTYADSAYGVVRIAEEGDHLVLRESSLLVGDLEHWHHDTFHIRWRRPLSGEGWVTFRLDTAGRISGADVRGHELRRTP